MQNLIDDQMKFLFIQAALKKMVGCIFARKEIVNLKSFAVFLSKLVKIFFKGNFLRPTVSVKQKKPCARFGMQNVFEMAKQRRNPDSARKTNYCAEFMRF